MRSTIQHKSTKSFIIIKIIQNHLTLRVPKTLASSDLYRDFCVGTCVMFQYDLKFGEHINKMV